MQQYEYRAVPAPARAAKVKGVKDPAERYAYAVSEVMNALAAEGWEYWRAEALPCTERKGLTGSVTVYYSLMVFRRPTADAMAAQMTANIPATTPVAAQVAAPSPAAPAPQMDDTGPDHLSPDDPTPDLPASPAPETSSGDDSELPGRDAISSEGHDQPADHHIYAHPASAERRRAPPLSARTPPGNAPPLTLRRSVERDDPTPPTDDAEASAEIDLSRAEPADPEPDTPPRDEDTGADATPEPAQPPVTR